MKCWLPTCAVQLFGIVAGNVKEVGIRAIEEFGPYKINGDKEIMRRMDDLLQGFVAQHRMKLPGSAYIPCYKCAHNIPPGDVCCGFCRFFVACSSTHFICYMNVSYHPHATNIITVNISHTIYIATQTFPYFHKPYFLALKKKLSP